jgi:hypothetical protein
LGHGKHVLALTDLGSLELSLPGRAWMSLLEPRFVPSLHC